MTEPQIRDAATVIVLDRKAAAGPSVLMGQRGVQASFMPSKYVFPGGAVDPEDAWARIRPADTLTRKVLSLAPRPASAPRPEAILAAGLRELAEETGLMTGVNGAAPEGWTHYIRSGLCPDASAMFCIFRAITPPGRTRRFDARFFLLDAERIAGDLHDFGAACDELSHLHWVPLSQARALDLPFITEVVLAEVAGLAQRPGPLAQPDRVPFFDNSGDEPRFVTLAA
ncbi:NUDIX hydrolase [Paracoccus ravus]|uniref:NUDIX hydrolase n=1 Tax=Paracoccus ravus TaxID=2447760 RepID=UPI00106E58F9|nr:NUDIX hydrolase [Paracoccus ravus]